MRQVVLDTETTGISVAEGHRIIEIGCIELLDRRVTGRQYQVYLNPDRLIDQGAIEVHGLTNEFLQDKQRFEDIADEFMDFVRGAELIIHNAPFDIGFIETELARMDYASGALEAHCTVLDTLVYARKKHPGQRNSLDALCKRYAINNSHRTLHGALLDAEILAEVFLMMTGGQSSLLDDEGGGKESAVGSLVSQILKDRKPLPVVFCTPEEQVLHEARLKAIAAESDGVCLWLQDKRH
ncbi:MAG: DNA polymerase III subunit epsilon [Methylococcales bacterium]|jgi:DNA polymerase-3 subunit epsilon|nr:DNA polymerase III subunit epsilon [Methylococcales bacterium]